MFAISQLAHRRCAARSARSISTRHSRSAPTSTPRWSASWTSVGIGRKVLRYEIKNITPPHDILAAMEKQMRAEREKRAVILTSEGTRDAAINTAEGVKQEVIKASEARKQQQINEAEGQASAILAVATATAEGIRKVAESIKMDGGYEAVQLRVAELHRTVRGAGEEEQHARAASQRCRRRLDDCARDDGDQSRRPALVRRRLNAAGQPPIRKGDSPFFPNWRLSLSTEAGRSLR